MNLRPILAACALAALLGAAARADDRSAAELLPATTVAYVEMQQPGQLLETVLEHPAWHWLESQENYREALESKPYLQFKAVVAVVEAQLGRSWRRLLQTAAGDGAYFAVDAKTEAWAVLLKAQDEETHQQVLATIVALARFDAQRRSVADPVVPSEHSGVTIYELDKAQLAVFGRWLVVSNKGDFLRQVVANAHDASDAVLAKEESFQAARRLFAEQPTAWGYLNLSAMREAGIGRRLSRATQDNPLGELVAGGTLGVLEEAPYASAGLTVRADELRLQLVSPNKPEWFDGRREYYFGPEGKGAAPPLLSSEGVLLSLSTYRDVSQLWLRAGELFGQKINDDLAQADSNLSTLFSGRDFGADILGAVRPEIQIVAARQSFAAEGPQPAIKLPAFALIFRLREPERMQSELRRTFQSLVGFLNIVGAMNGQPQLDLDMEKHEDHQLVTSTYLPEPDQDLQRLPIHFNFSPSVGFAGERFVVSSTKELARELMRGQAGETDGHAQNTAAVADLASLRHVLADNRQQLVAQNMLEEGHTRAEAEGEIEALLELLGFLRDVSLQLTSSEETLQFVLQLKLNEQ